MVHESASDSDLPVSLPDIPPASHATQQATLAVIGNFRGFQKPCSCTPEQDGGLARLGNLLSSLDASDQFSLDTQSANPDAELVQPGEISIPAGLQSQPIWPIELGNFAWNRIYFPGLRARTHLQVLAAVGARAAIPGASELDLDLSDAVYSLTDSPVPLVSCNLDVEPEGIAIQPSLQLAENWYLIGVTNNKDGQGITAAQDWWNLRDAASAARESLGDLPQDCFVIVAGASLDHELATEMLKDQRVQACIGVRANFQRMNETEPAMYRDPIPKATTLDLYSIDASARAITDWPMKLSQQFSDDGRVIALIKHEGELSRQKLSEQRAARAAAAGGGGDNEFGMSNKFLPEDQRVFSFDDEPYYVGGESCLHCHREAADIWRSTRHAGALHSLKQEGQADMLDCLACHSTGLLQMGGYDPLAPDMEMAAVGCESCHGPGSHHVEGMKQGISTSEDKFISRQTVDGCIRCHDPYNSPHFKMDEYWEKISH